MTTHDRIEEIRKRASAKSQISNNTWDSWVDIEWLLSRIALADKLHIAIRNQYHDDRWGNDSVTADVLAAMIEYEDDA